MSAPSPEAIEACRDLCFDALHNQFEHAASYARSAAEAAFRGSQTEIEVRLQQLRLVLTEAVKTFKELKGQP